MRFLLMTALATAALALPIVAAAVDPAQTAGAAARPERRVPVPRHGEDAGQRAADLRRQLRLARADRVLLGRPHRQPQRGRARQVRLRPLLRAPDVPRQREVFDRGLQRRHQVDRRRFERVHVRRPDRVPHPRRQGGAAQDRRDRGRPLPAPQVRRGQVPEGSRRGAGRIQQERVEPDREDGRDAVRQRVHHAHVQAHDDGLPEGHRGDAQGVRVFAPVLRPLLPARQRRSSWWSATPIPRPCSSWSSSTTANGSRAASARRCRSSRRRNRRSAPP